MKKFLCLLLCLCMLGTMLVACGGKENPPVVTTDDQGTTGDPDNGDEPIVSGFEVKAADLSKYTIIYPDGAASSLSNAVEDLREAIEEKFDVSLSSNTDYLDEDEGETAGEYEILVGATNRLESTTGLLVLNVNDYVYCVADKKILILAHDDYTASLAVADFITNVVNAAADDATVFMASSQDKVKESVYNLGTMTIGGTDISEYVIVYPEADEALEAALAEKVKNAIAEACGVVLTVQSDATPAVGNEILVGLTNRNEAAVADGATNKGYIALANGNVQLAGNTAYGIGLAVDAFTALFENAAEADTLALNITNGVVEDTSAAISSMSFNIQRTSINENRQARVLETIVKYLPDTVGLQACTGRWATYIENNLSAYYNIVGVGREADENGEPTGETNYILYAKEKFTLVDSGTKWLSENADTVGSVYNGASEARIYTWATLKRNADDVEFMHINTAFDTQSSDIRQAEASMLLDFMYANEDKAIVLTGNFLANKASAEYTLLIAEKLNDAAVIAASAETSNRISAEDLVDYVLVADEYIDVNLFIAADDRVNGDYASNSDALYIEFVVDMDGTDVADKDLSGSGDGLVVVPDREGGDYSDPEIIF